MFLPLKALFRKGGTAPSILAIALLVAILASITSVVNHVNSQTQTLSKLRGTGETFLLMSNNSTSLTNSKVSTELIQILNENDAFKYILPQKIFTATMITISNNYTVQVTGVNTTTFFQVRHAYVNGSFADGMQANVGEILARIASIHNTDKIGIAYEDKTITVEVAGIIQTRTQSDSELIVPMNVANLLTEDNSKVSIIEFAIKANGNEEIRHINELLPADVKIVVTQQTQTFVQDLNNQTLYFLSLWSIPVYAVVTATAYMITARLTIESSYELTMLKALGAKRTQIFKLILVVTFIITSLGTIVGIAIGVAGAQIISTTLQWAWKGIQITPFLEIQQTTQIILFALTASVLGCIYPAIKATRKTYAELQL